MADWFARLMQQGDAHSRRAIAAAGFLTRDEGRKKLDARDPRYDALVRMLRDREAEDRAAREKRQRGYRQSLESDSAPATGPSSEGPPVRLHQLRAKVPCRVMPEARTLLDELRQQFAGGAVTLPPLASGRQAVMVTPPAGTEPRQIGWLEHCVQGDPKLCNVSDQGLSVETDGGSMLVLRFRYPATAVKMSAGDARGTTDAASRVDFAEIRAALDLRPIDRRPPPRLLWVTRAEADTMHALRSRDYEAFYVRFKRELLAAIWSSLSASLSSAPQSRWHRGTHYTVVCEPDAANGRICQSTVDDGGRAVDIGLDRGYDAAPATDILILHLDTDILADVADIYFTIRSISSPDAYALKEELFAIIRRFWASSRSLASPCGGELATVLRMARGALPMPVQAALLKQDWTNLRQSLVERYGEGGRKAAHLLGRGVHRPRASAVRWPFATFPVGDVNVGLRFVYQVAGATVEEMKWPLDADGCINLGVRGLSASSEMGLEAECRESSRDTSTRLGNIMRRMVSAGDELAPDQDTAACEPLTRLAEVQNVILVAEKLPSPAEIDVSWVRRHDWILGKVLLDESFRDALDTIGHEARNAQLDQKLEAKRGRLYEHLRANILHYQRAIWQHEDPQQRSMRYRKAGRKVPLEWRFELESSGALTIEELCARLDAPDVNGRFAAYSAGREAELDQVIDPAGPVGYYANYAVYQMRPELASGDLFSMLHFFKSPWLRPNRKTGQPEVADPAQALVSEDPAVAVPGGQRGKENVERTHGAIRPENMPDGWRVILEGARAFELLRTIGRREPEAEWVVTRSAGEGTTRMVGGRCPDPKEEPVILQRNKGERMHDMVAGRAPDAGDEWLIAAPGDGNGKPASFAGADPAHEWAMLTSRGDARTPSLVAGAGVPDADERAIIPRDESVLRLRPSVAEKESAAYERVIFAGLDQQPTPMLRAGRARAGVLEWLMLTRNDEAPKLTQRAGTDPASAHERVILAGSVDWLRPSLVAG